MYFSSKDVTIVMCADFIFHVNNASVMNKVLKIYMVKFSAYHLKMMMMVVNLHH